MLYAKITETSILNVNNKNFPDPWILMKRSTYPYPSAQEMTEQCDSFYGR